MFQIRAGAANIQYRIESTRFLSADPLHSRVLEQVQLRCVNSDPTGRSHGKSSPLLRSKFQLRHPLLYPVEVGRSALRLVHESLLRQSRAKYSNAQLVQSVRYSPMLTPRTPPIDRGFKKHGFLKSLCINLRCGFVTSISTNWVSGPGLQTTQR
jgi:hypothetical protein